ncbi:MAG: TIGR03960 family B12-binding radical SAM protein [Candidatus Margulisiibacteriota bacterium]
MHDLIRDKILPAVSKPARYIGNELNSIHKGHKGMVKVALCYPDTYEIGMSNLGLSILYHLIIKREDAICERVFSPWPDMEAAMKEHGVPLFSLESWKPIKDFDILGFSLQHELTYTNMLNILKLSDIPLKRKERTGGHPLIIAGGACTNNPEPLSDFIDAFVLGDGEEVIREIIDAYKSCRDRPQPTPTHTPLLDNLSKIDGVYVPDHNELKNVKRRTVKDLNSIDYPAKPIVPFIEVVHDRATIEIMRGCPRRCSFCQAGTVNKPVRLVDPEKVVALAKETIKNTGFEEVSLVSLSSCDYPRIWEVANELGKAFGPKRISVSLPSMRPDSFRADIAKELQNVRKSGITLAPEAGTQRLRDHIHKDLTEENILSSIGNAFASGANSVKLYFMIGLPTETEEDLAGIVALSNRIIKEGKTVNPRAKITVNVSTFIPKKNTPFENEKMISLDKIQKKQNYLKQNLRHKSIELRWHKAEMSVIEGLFSSLEAGRGLPMAKILLDAFEAGCRFDNWTEHFDYCKWEVAIAAHKDQI